MGGCRWGHHGLRGHLPPQPNVLTAVGGSAGRPRWSARARNGVKTCEVPTLPWRDFGKYVERKFT